MTNTPYQATLPWVTIWDQQSYATGTKYEHELYLQDFTIQEYDSASSYNSFG